MQTDGETASLQTEESHTMFCQWGFFKVKVLHKVFLRAYKNDQAVFMDRVSKFLSFTLVHTCVVVVSLGGSSVSTQHGASGVSFHLPHPSLLFSTSLSYVNSVAVMGITFTRLHAKDHHGDLESVVQKAACLE